MLTPAYEPKLTDHLLEATPVKNGLRNTTFILYSGSKVGLAEMEEFRKTLRRDIEAGNMSWESFCNGIQC